MTQTPQQVGRLALRQEGDWWVAYYAMPTTMDRAVELGRVRFSIALNPEHKQTFLSLMSGVVADLIEHQTGTRPDMIEGPAPQHERAGNA